MPRGAKIFDIAFTVFIYLLAAAILIGAIFFAFSTSPDKALFGYRYYTVLTGSMEPTYKVGDMIFVKLTEGKDVNVGDVITFNPSQDSDAYLTHRVTEKLENYEGTETTCFRTQGDANNAQDSFLIDESRVIGVVKFGIPGLGYVVRFVQLRWYFILPVAIMIAIFFQLLKRFFLIGKDDEESKDKDSKGVLAEGDQARIETEKTDETVSENDTDQAEDTTSAADSTEAPAEEVPPAEEETPSEQADEGESKPAE